MKEHSVRKFICMGLLVCCLAFVSHASTAPKAFFFEDPGLPAPPIMTEVLKESLLEEGYTLVPVQTEELSDPAFLKKEKAVLLALPDGSRLPMAAIPTVNAFLEEGGNLVAFNAPLWQERLASFDGQWLSLEEYRNLQAGTALSHCFLDFSKESLDSWKRSAYRMDAATRYELLPAEDLGPGKTAFSVTMPDMENWDSACRYFEASPFAEGHAMTVFSAKGGPRTNRLAVELHERDGSRWLASVPLTEQWQQFMLLPEEFEFWESVPSRRDTVVNPAEVDMIAFTLAYSHTGHLHGAHQFAVADVGSAPLNEAYREARKELSVPAWDIVSPSYKFYPMTDVQNLVTATDGLMPSGRSLSLPQVMQSVQPRPEGGGFDKGRSWRWIPLIEALGSDGSVRGYPAAMVFQGEGKGAGGCRVTFAVSDVQWYEDSAVRAVLRASLQAMERKVVLIDGGAEYYTVFEDLWVQMGATMANRGATDEVVQVEFKTLDKVGKNSSTHSTKARIPAGEQLAVPLSILVLKGRSLPIDISVKLLQDGEVLDEVHHELHLWQPPASPNFVTAGEGRFNLNGERWIPHGLNYMPSSGIGVEDRSYFEKWLRADAYHPRIIQRDLERCAAMGCNALSIFIYHDSLKGRNLVDLLRRMDDLGMKANLSLRPGTPMDFEWELMKELIEVHRLAENDTVFAYDLAWEPQFRPYERTPFNEDWEAWVIERYGSIENAEKDWGEPFIRDEEGAPLNITAEMVARGGEGAPRLAAYRRFLDTLLYEKYSQARSLVQSIDPNHPVSFRMSMAGDPTDRQTEALLYDFAYLGGAVDIFEPEAYGRIGDWDKVKPGWFTGTYARWANPALPVLWAEAGMHVWDLSTMAPSEDILTYQAQYYRDFYRMLMSSHADGIFWWWYPGGYRVDEKSDYGIINPDGTDRPVTEVIREHAPLMQQGTQQPAADLWLTMDRDRHNNGLTGIYSEVQEAFWKGLEDGKVPGLRTEGTGTDSRSCPALAVGNTALTGNNPPKYLDAFFDSVSWKTGGGDWVEIEKGSVLPVPDDRRAMLRVSLTNLGEATLVPPEGDREQAGDVYLVLSGSLSRRIPLPRPFKRFESLNMDIPLWWPKSTKAGESLKIQLEASRRSTFGSVFTLQLENR